MKREMARFNMVEQQIRSWKPLDPNTLESLHIVQREDYVPAPLRDLAFADTALPLGHDECMFEPKLEALALSALAIKPHERLLEVGTGSGFMAALLAAHADEVWSIERIPELAAMARTNLQNSGVDNVTVEVGDGLQGLAQHVPYDAIMISGGVHEVPAALLAQLKPGGRLFAVVGKAPVMQAQLLSLDVAGNVSTKVLCETVVPHLHDGSMHSSFVF